jgi:hypothetical protein
MTFTSLLTHTAAIQTNVSSQNELGEWLLTYTTSSTPFACRMSPITAMERIDPTGRFDDVRYRCFSESSTRISVDNRVVYNGTVYRVKEVILDSSYHHKSSLLAEL